MRKSELLRKIEALERRILALELRVTLYVPVPYVPLPTPWGIDWVADPSTATPLPRRTITTSSSS
jgi:hypothetical protein